MLEIMAPDCLVAQRHQAKLCALTNSGRWRQDPAPPWTHRSMPEPAPEAQPLSSAVAEERIAKVKVSLPPLTRSHCLGGGHPPDQKGPRPVSVPGEQARGLSIGHPLCQPAGEKVTANCNDNSSNRSNSSSNRNSTTNSNNNSSNK